MTQRAEELARLWFGNDPALAKPVVVRELASLMEQYGALVREEAAKVADNPGVFDYDVGRQHAAELIREMKLP